MLTIFISPHVRFTLYTVFVWALASVQFVHAGEGRLANPLAGSGITSVNGLLVAILNIVIVLAMPIIVFFIILAGFKYVTARGNATQTEEATRALTYAIIGGVLVLGAVAISAIIGDVVTQFQG